ncbi:TadE/TadG family type IV pilus assembly protein [Sphingopyxis solisilvae]|uniref:TadE/TadG family type IV pilus assembly protein n=1 Tax=Sphingopyxis solisilvae TaxID=1886788 RepID=UPI001892B790|nr:TadE family protein [Sphingopyxis solisilvae]
MMCRSFLRRLRRSEQGNAIVEFALTAPLFLLILMGIFDFSWQIYGKQVLQGAVSKAARDATLENNAVNQAALDTKVRQKVLNVFKNGDVTFERKSYDSYSEVGQPEAFTDSNKNGVYDAGECFEDVNGNSNWDADRGATGNGGAEDVVLYTATLEIERVLPVWKMLGQSPTSRIQATTVLRNQPYNAATSTKKVICT